MGVPVRGTHLLKQYKNQNCSNGIENRIPILPGPPHKEKFIDITQSVVKKSAQYGMQQKQRKRQDRITADFIFREIAANKIIGNGKKSGPIRW